jgi:hypothetical protein
MNLGSALTMMAVMRYRRISFRRLLVLQSEARCVRTYGVSILFVPSIRSSPHRTRPPPSAPGRYLSGARDSSHEQVSERRRARHPRHRPTAKNLFRRCGRRCWHVPRFCCVQLADRRHGRAREKLLPADRVRRPCASRASIRWPASSPTPRSTFSASRFQ